jgi:hypothetical protein
MKRILDNLRLNFYNFLNNFMASPANTWAGFLFFDKAH